MMMALLWPTYLAGNKKNQPVVFLHGFMGSHKDWFPIIESLKENFYCIAPDLPGHGTNCPKEGLNSEFSLPKFAHDVRQLLDQLDIEQADIVGYSMGGRVALHFALDHPSCVRKLLLENASPGIENESDRAARRKTDEERAQKIQNNFGQFIEKWYQAGLFSSLEKHGERFEKLKTARKSNDPTWVAKVIKDLSPGKQVSVWHRLHELEMPVQLIGGELDEKYLGQLQKIAKQVPQAKFDVVAQAGHNTHFENPEKFIKLVLDFLLEE